MVCKKKLQTITLGAGNRGRTCTGLPMDPKSIASANSAIPAIDRLFAV